MRRLAFVVEVECIDREAGSVDVAAVVRSGSHGFVLGAVRWTNHGALAPSMGYPLDAITGDAVRRAITDAGYVLLNDEVRS